MIFPINELQFLENPIVKGLIDANILYYQKYEPYLRVQRQLYVFFIREWVQNKKKNMKLAEKMRFFMFKRRFGMDYSIASPYHKGSVGSLSHYEARMEYFNHEVWAYRGKTPLDEDYDKITSKKGKK